MTNLEYLSKFLTETYGAVCFHNDEMDGYTSFTVGEKKEIETLAIYFPNKLDEKILSVQKRLSNAVGEYFYKRYIGAKNLTLCPVNGSVLLVRFIKNGKTLGITIDETAYRLCGGIFDIIQYFIGNNIKDRVLERPNNYSQPMPTNNGFYIGTGENIKTCIERFLLKNNLPLISNENGFYVSEIYKTKTTEQAQNLEINYREPLKEIQLYFLNEDENIGKIRESRNREFQQSLRYMTRQDWEAFHQARGIDAMPIPRNNGFDD